MKYCHFISIVIRQEASQVVSICSANPWQTTNLHTGPTKVVNLTALSLVKLFSITSSMDYGLALFLRSKDVKVESVQEQKRCRRTNNPVGIHECALWLPITDHLCLSAFLQPTKAAPTLLFNRGNIYNDLLQSYFWIVHSSNHLSKLHIQYGKIS